MGAAITNLVQVLVSEEVRRIVADAVGDGGCVSASSAAAQVLKAYPNCGLAEREIADEIALAASRAGVAVEFGRRMPALAARRPSEALLSQR